MDVNIYASTVVRAFARSHLPPFAQALIAALVLTTSSFRLAQMLPKPTFFQNDAQVLHHLTRISDEQDCLEMCL